MCVIGDNGKFNLGHYSCPGTTLFSDKYRRCVEAELSECVPLTTSSPSISTTELPADTTIISTTLAPTTTTGALPEFVCEKEGRFKDELDLTCKWYT